MKLHTLFAVTTALIAQTSFGALTATVTGDGVSQMFANGWGPIMVDVHLVDSFGTHYPAGTHALSGAGPNNLTGVTIPPILFGQTVQVCCTGPSTITRGNFFVAVSGSGVAFSSHYLFSGDINGDNTVDIGDFAILSLAFWTEPSDPGYNIAADLNRDDVIDMGDVALLSLNWMRIGDCQ